MMKSGRTRKRWVLALLVLLTIAAGLGSRQLRGAAWSASFDLLGDALWSMMVYFLFALLAPRAGISSLVIAALAFSVAIEFSQLYHAPWIDLAREYRLGGLVLGYSFDWRDLLWYLLGIAAGAGIDRAVHK